MSPLVQTEIADRVAVVTLNDPDRRNALNLAMVQEIVATFDSLEANREVGAVVVTGAGSAFCAGADLGHLGGSSGDGGRQGLLNVYDGFLRVARSTLPTLAAINGAAVGAGMNLALCCDVRLAARRARFDSRFLQLGLHPGGGHTWMSLAAIGPQAAFATVVFGEVLDGAEAERIGLVWRAVDDDKLLDEARAMAGRAASGPPDLVRRMKQTLREIGEVKTHDDAVAYELEPQLWSVRQPAFAERLAALQKQITSKQ